MMLARNTFAMLDRSAELFVDRPALGFGDDTYTFRQLRDRAEALAGGLYAAGVRAGDRVAVMMGNRVEWVDTFFAVARLGAICVPVNVLSTAEEIRHVCSDSRASLLIADEIANDVLDAASAPFDHAIALGDTACRGRSSTARWSDVATGPELPDGYVGPALQDQFVLYYSSGTTGLPKAAIHSHNGILWNALGQAVGLRLSDEVRYAVIPSFSWAAGMHNLVLALVWLGGFSQVKPTGGATMEGIVDLIERHDITHVMLVPSLLRELTERPDLVKRLAAARLRWIVTGAEPVPASIIDGLCGAIPGVDVCQGYGLSEFPSMATVLRGDEVATHANSAGRPLPHTDVAVRTDEGTIAKAGTGELLLRSLATMDGYFEREAETAEAFKDGWLNTGDIARIDDEGYVHIIGRTKDMIISGGLNVYPREIEDVIVQVPGVREVAVVGVPHERFGETAVAVIVTDDPDFDIATADTACEVLAGYKRPRRSIVSSDPLPRSANSKVVKRELRPWVLAAVQAEAPSSGDFLACANGDAPQHNSTVPTVHSDPC